MLSDILADPLVYGAGAGLLLGVAVLPFLIKSRASAEDESPILPEEPAGPAVEPVAAVAADAADAEPAREEAEPREQPAPAAAAPSGERGTTGAYEGGGPLAAAAEPPARVRAPAPEPALPKNFNTGMTTTGGISPAIAYLQGLKKQIEHFESEIHELRGQVQNFAQMHDTQFQDLLKRMTEVQSELHHQVRAQAESAPVPAPRAEPAAKPAPAARAPAPARKAKTVEPPKAAEPAKPVEPPKAAEPAKPVEPPKAAEPIEAAEPAMADEPAKPAEPAQAPVEERRPSPARKAGQTAPKLKPVEPPAEQSAPSVTLRLEPAGGSDGANPPAAEPAPQPAVPPPARELPKALRLDVGPVDVPEEEAPPELTVTDEPKPAPRAQMERTPAEEPVAQGPEEEDILKPKGKGPVWPV